MKSFVALLTRCEGNAQATTIYPHKGLVTLSFGFPLLLFWTNVWGKPPSCRWFETPWCFQLRLFTQVLFRRRSKKKSKLRVTHLCKENSPVTPEFPAQMPSNAENVSIWWRYHVLRTIHWINAVLSWTTSIWTRHLQDDCCFYSNTEE